MKEFELEHLEKVWYLFNYFNRYYPDYVNQQLTRYKDDSKAHVSAFAAAAAEGFEELMPAIDYIIRVLGSNELTAKSPNKVRSLALAIKNVLGCEYRPLWLRKNRATRPLKYLKKQQRIDELDGVYELINEPDLNGQNILIVDDITTTGTSLEVIAQLIKGRYPNANVYGFLLAKTFNPNWIGNPTANDKEDEDFVRALVTEHTRRVG